MSVTVLFVRMRVTPIEVISPPKLNICGALLLTKMDNLITQRSLTHHSINFWTDIVYSWLNKTLTSWNIFLTDRVSPIFDAVGTRNWRNDKPADIASHGYNAGLKENPG